MADAPRWGLAAFVALALTLGIAAWWLLSTDSEDSGPQELRSGARVQTGSSLEELRIADTDEVLVIERTVQR